MILVTGAGGFIGGHLVADLLQRGHAVRAVDYKPLNRWHQLHAAAVNQPNYDLRRMDNCHYAARGCHTIYNLAADMGGMGFIEKHKADCMLSVLINTQLLQAAHVNKVDRYFFSSSACVYAAGKQDSAQPAPLVESDAYPAAPEDGYGWEKLFSERMCRHFLEDYQLETRVARYHNVYGTYGTWEGERAKAPAALCRKVAEAAQSGNHTISIWGDGEQARSFMHIDDCVRGTVEVAAGQWSDPVNLGSSELVTINQLVSILEEIAGIKLTRTYELSAPRGVRGRNSDNTLFRSRYGWEPSVPLRLGMEQLYRWVYDQVALRR